MTNIIEEFNGIKFLKSTNSPIELDSNTNLYTLFMSIINKNNLEVYQYHLQQILFNELNINSSKLSTQLIAVLVDALIYYIIRWPGWQRHNEYHSGKLTVEDWFCRFQQYLIFKSKFVIRSAPTQSVCEDTSTQTDCISEKGLAPYGIYIGAPAYVLNNIVFEERNGDVFLRRCVQRIWKDPTLKELVHWPYVSVTLKLPDIHLSRSNLQNIVRYMGLVGDLVSDTEPDHITHIKKLSETEKMNTKSYSLEFFTLYVQQLIRILGKIPGVSANRFREIELILNEFLSDIKEANVYNKTMCTSTSVQYQIGKFTYIRNRKMIVSKENRISKNQNAVNYYESISPQMEINLHHFRAVQDKNDMDGISFVSLNKLETALKMKSIVSNSLLLEDVKKLINTSSVAYSCRLCQKHLYGPNAQIEIVQHLRTEHKAEQPMLCYKCCKEFEISVLASNRWQHNCTPVTEKKFV